MTDQRQTILGPVGRFFFSPTDPTTLGFMRIMTGLVLLYTHAAYTPDLQEFFGPARLVGPEAGNRQRREAPSMAAPLGWRAGEPTLRNRRASPTGGPPRSSSSGAARDPAAERKARLRYLERLVALTPSPTNPYDGPAYQNATQAVPGRAPPGQLGRPADRRAEGPGPASCWTPTPPDDSSPRSTSRSSSRPCRGPSGWPLWDDALAFGQALPGRRGEAGVRRPLAQEPTRSCTAAGWSSS